MDIRNIGIFAHVDAGKTTLSEQLLLRAGAIRKAGSVDSGTAHTDSLPVEQRRGISVKASCVRLTWRGTDINLVDTPGHADFSAEVERSFWALDGAVLIVSAAEGVQPQTELLFRALREQRIPAILFLNKTDREGADIDRTLRQIRRRLTPDIVKASDAEAVTEFVCAEDDDLTERYFAGETFSPDFINEKLREAVSDCRAVPWLAGSALRGIGIEPVLDAMVGLLPPPSDTGSRAAVVFACTYDRVLGRGVWARMYGGSFENREAVELSAGIDPFTGEEKRVQRKITQIRDVDGSDMGRLRAGQIGVVYGLGDIGIGYVFGEPPRRVSPGSLRTPLITVKAIPDDPDGMEALRRACETLSLEDPLLEARYVRSLGELQLHVMGTIQLEILQETLETRFGLKASFSPPAVIYRETIAESAVGFVAYTMPKPCWAVMKFLIEPAERGSGVHFSSAVPVRELAIGYQNQAAQALPIALAQGRLGWPVTDVNITLIEGNSHQWHTHPLDFIVATPMGIHDGLRRGGSVLLEPILEIRFLIPPECVGRVMSDVAQMRGEVTSTLADEDRTELTALVPVSESLTYPQSFASVTGGRGSMSTRLHGFRECPLELGTTSPRRNVDPLDTSRYILAARSALDGGIFDI